jgi:tetratricopeptide (TPR) repeat protein
MCPTAYNQPVVHTTVFSQLRRVGQLIATLGVSLAFAFTMTANARGQAASGSGRILLVLPFDNRTGQPSLEWIREAAPEILSSRFGSAAFAPMSRQDRRYALDHLGLPEGFHPSRATALKLAETLDADSIIVGSYVTDGTAIVAEAQIVDVPHLKISAPVTARGEMRDMVAVFDSLAWKLTRQLDPGFKGSEETFVAAGKGLRLDAFEQYIRGITEPDQAERLRHLQQAVKLSPEFSPAWMALGREDYNGQQYDKAAEAFAKVGRGDPDALEAGFYGGLSLIFNGDYGKAEAAFGGVARVLPLAEVVNNQGVAVSREGHDGSELFRQAVAADPTNADYHFNLAVSLKRHGNAADALTELAQCLLLRPKDSEAQDLDTAWKTPAGVKVAGFKISPKPDSSSGPAAEQAAEPKADPLERIARNFDAVAFRQAALMMDEMDASRLAVLTPRERAQKLAGQARDYLDRGLLLEAERLYLSAVAADGNVAEGHEGLAEVRERTGDAEAARKEARAALKLEPTANAYLVLGRLDLAEGQTGEADREAVEALKLAPQSRAAHELQQQIKDKEGLK